MNDSHPFAIYVLYICMDKNMKNRKALRKKAPGKYPGAQAVSEDTIAAAAAGKQKQDNNKAAAIIAA